MKHYIEITLLPGQEIPLYFLWSKVYMQLHLAFVEQKDSNEQVEYGISFPDYVNQMTVEKKVACSLGARARIFADTPEKLHSLNLKKWLERLEDYIHMKGVKPVEKATRYLVVNRQREEPSPEKWARRHAKRHNISFDKALEKWNKKNVIILDAIQNTGSEQAKRMEVKTLRSPYIEIKSLSGDHAFSLAIKQTYTDQMIEGKFSTYGLSSSSTVPHW
ncbi:type I-F CRISPR-associated endoribonuclease Cas6/Csy4 [Limnobacter sp.]|uniref:type I-F CRISPR-associated endoribonuclease Cas6/Csy4 n=1 Tax=Limnobacter sp. TaxID=2003368 RepID=UPI002FE113D0